jgi:hypothetical protein
MAKKADATLAQSSQEQPRPAKKGGPGRPFKPGQSGNPGGRPAIPTDVKELARQFTPAAIVALAKLAGLVLVEKDGKKIPVGIAYSESVQRQALCDLLDRGYGKPTTVVEGTGEDGKIVIELVKFGESRGQD